MKVREFSNVASVIPFASAVLLVAISLGLVATDRAQAATSQFEIMVQIANCFVGCDSRQTACNSGCCILGGLLCGGRCINKCQATSDQCKNDCNLTAIGGTPEGAFFDTVTLATNQRTLHIGGPFFCPEGATADLDVTLTQHGIGAVAQGRAHIQCPVDGDTSFALDASTVGNTLFKPLGKAQACGTARIHSASLSLDSFQWCREVTVLPEGVELQ
jgi:hypothetical protein